MVFVAALGLRHRRGAFPDRHRAQPRRRAAGHNLARFADLVGPNAVNALRSVALEEEQDATAVVAELVFIPRNFRVANIIVRPETRRFQVRVGSVSRSSRAETIPLDEVAVGVRGGKFYLRWVPRGVYLRVSNTHMLNPTLAPEVCRFLSEVDRDGSPQLTMFSWGPAEGFPFLPRIQSGRVVLRPAEWKIDAETRRREVRADSAAEFSETLTRWILAWDVPRHVFLTVGDNRLLLDLAHPDHVEELRQEVLRQGPDGAAVTLQEAIPSLEQAWVEGPSGRYLVELTASLILSEMRPATDSTRSATENSPPPDQPSARPSSTYPPKERLKPLGSDWLFLKLYCGRKIHDELIAGPLRQLLEDVGFDEGRRRWFFVRYADPDDHLRIRFEGEPADLLSRTLPIVCDWASNLIDEGTCSRSCFDSYDREIERYGGTSGAEVAETIFSVDSRAVVELLHLKRSRISGSRASRTGGIGRRQPTCGIHPRSRRTNPLVEKQHGFAGRGRRRVSKTPGQAQAPRR